MSVWSVSPLASWITIRVAPPALVSRYQMSAPYCGLGAWKSWWPVDPPSMGASPHWNAVRGAKRYAGIAATVLVSCWSGATSTIQNPRPCVAAMSSASRGWILRSCTGTFGSPVMNFCQVAPRSPEM